MSERGSRPERVGVINLPWIAVNIILVCAVLMVKRSLGSYWSCPASGSGYFVGNLGLVGFIVGYCRKKIVCETSYISGHFGAES